MEIQWSDHCSGNGHLPATFPAVSSDSELLKVPTLTDTFCLSKLEMSPRT